MAVGSLLLTALTGKAAGSRPRGPHAAAPLLARGMGAPHRPGRALPPGCRAAGEAVGEAGGADGVQVGRKRQGEGQGWGRRGRRQVRPQNKRGVAGLGGGESRVRPGSRGGRRQLHPFPDPFPAYRGPH